MGFGINRYAVGSIASNKISILPSFLSADVTIQSITFVCPAHTDRLFLS